MVSWQKKLSLSPVSNWLLILKILYKQLWLWLSIFTSYFTIYSYQSSRARECLGLFVYLCEKHTVGRSMCMAEKGFEISTQLASASFWSTQIGCRPNSLILVHMTIESIDLLYVFICFLCKNRKSNSCVKFKPPKHINRCKNWQDGSLVFDVTGSDLHLAFRRCVPEWRQ